MYTCVHTHIHAPPSTQCHVSRPFWERLGPSPSVCPLLPSAHCSTPSLHSFTWNFPSLLDHNPYVHYYFHLSITNNLWHGGASNKLWGKKENTQLAGPAHQAESKELTGTGSLQLRDRTVFFWNSTCCRRLCNFHTVSVYFRSWASQGGHFHLSVLQSEGAGMQVQIIEWTALLAVHHW